MHSDWRNVENGYEIPSENYCDQPYVVVTRDGSWLCLLTTGPGEESKSGQHVVATLSADKGRSWSELIDIEPPSDHLTSWVTALVVPSGRVYAIYDYEADEESTMHGGWLVFKYSDDGGRTWSAKRYRIPLRITRCDRENVTDGRAQFFWCIDKPVAAGGFVYLGLPKLKRGVPQYWGESWVVRTDNILTEDNPEKIHWELLPEGDDGIYSPDLGNVQEEQNIEVLSDGTLYMVLRTEIGVMGHTISRDKGKTWTKPEVLRYSDGQPIRNPRACPRIWKAPNGKFLLWFHNNAFPGWGGSANRNPVWVSSGVEKDNTIAWSQPEILLYHSDPTVRGMSYPDFIAQDEKIWVTATQKTVARVHELNLEMLEAVWNQGESDSAVAEDLIYDSGGKLAPGGDFQIPALPNLRSGGFSVDLWARFESLDSGQILLNAYGPQASGFRIETAEKSALRLELHDGVGRQFQEVLDGAEPVVRNMRKWNGSTDEACLRSGELHHVVFIVDGQARVLSIVVDGRLCDGGDRRIQGWWKLPQYLEALDHGGRCRVDPGFRGSIEWLRIYGRHLLTSEAIANYRAGCPKKEA